MKNIFAKLESIIKFNAKKIFRILNHFFVEIIVWAKDRFVNSHEDYSIFEDDDADKNFLLAFCCLIRFRGNIDSRIENFLNDLVSTGQVDQVCVILRIDDDDFENYYRSLIRRYSDKLSIFIIKGKRPINRNDFPALWRDLFIKSSTLQYKWFQIISDDCRLNKLEFLKNLTSGAYSSDAMFLSDKPLEPDTTAWFLNESGDQVTVRQPVTVDYPCVRKDFLTFLGDFVPEFPMWGPNMSCDTYMGMLFAETSLYDVINPIIRRDMQYHSFVNCDEANALRREAILENSTREYRRSKKIIIERYWEKF
jgi:hypothetical protein